MSRGPIALAVISALFLGAALGFMGGVMFTNHHFGWRGLRDAWGMHGRGFGPGPEGMRGMRVLPPARVILPWLERELDLSPEQVSAIRAEMARSRADLAGVHDSLHTRVARHLTPEQRKRFESMVKEHFPGDHRGRGPHSSRPGAGEEGEPK